jgi:hypothetical protein
MPPEVRETEQAITMADLLDFKSQIGRSRPDEDRECLLKLNGDRAEEHVARDAARIVVESITPRGHYVTMEGSVDGASRH